MLKNISIKNLKGTNFGVLAVRGDSAAPSDTLSLKKKSYGALANTNARINNVSRPTSGG
jgi:hypothetical protein